MDATGSDDTTSPLCSNSPSAWDSLIEAVGPASLLVVIESRLSPALRRQTTPEDVFQEALLHAWRDRARCEWRGIRSFRSWLLSIIDNRIREAADRLGAEKRGGGREPVVASALSGDTSGGSTADGLWPAISTTPSRVAIFREQAAAMQAALSELPEESREVVRLRLFEQLQIEEVAARLSLGESAVRHRFRKGAELYHCRLKAALATRAATRVESTTPSPAKSSPNE